MTKRRHAAGAVMVIAGAAMTAAVPTATAAHQPLPPVEARRASARDDADATGVQRAAAAVARIAALDLASVPTVSVQDYAIAAGILEIAHALAPGDEEILRRLLEAHEAADNSTRVLALLPRLLAVAPTDTLAQLRLITGRILDLQSVDERLAVYDRFLGPQGSGLDPAVRSRLALDAALLLREQGDERGFADRLATAIDLDPTNKDAASLALAFYSERVPDPVGRMELLITLFRADPLDPETHLAMARELSRAGAYDAAARSFAMGSVLRQLLGVGLADVEQAEMHILTWRTGGAAALVKAAHESITNQRQMLELRRQQAIAAGAAPSQLPSLTDVRLSLPVAKVVLIAAVATGDAEAVAWAMRELDIAAKALLQPGPAEQGGQPVPPDEATQREVFGDMLWMRLWSGQDLDLAAEQLDTLRATEGINPDALARLEGWYLMRRGDHEAAGERLRPLVERDPLALLGLAVGAEASGDAEAARAWYADLYRREAGSVVSAFAATRLEAMDAPVPSPTEMAQRLTAMVRAGVPRWAEDMVQDPRSFMALSLEPEPLEVPPGGRMAVRLRLRNISPLPLALGPGGPISSRFLLSPTIEYGLNHAAGVHTMTVVSLDRRLRLLPQEALEVTVRPELGPLWYVLNSLGDRNVHLRWRALQGFRMTPQGIFTAGPLSLSVESALQTRRPLAMAAAEPADLLEAIRTGDGERLYQALAGLGWRWAAPIDRGGLSDSDLGEVISAIADRYERSTLPERLMILAMTPAAGRVPAASPIDAAAREDRDPAAMALVLVTRITDPDDPIFKAAAASGDEALRDLAAAVADRLAAGIPTMARPIQPQPGGAPAGNR